MPVMLEIKKKINDEFIKLGLSVWNAECIKFSLNGIIPMCSLFPFNNTVRSQGCVAGVAINLQAGWHGVWIVQEKVFSAVHTMQIDSGAHPASYALVTGGSFPIVKWQGHEADHTLFCSADKINK